jgi:DNA-damage-inducible protein D
MPANIQTITEALDGIRRIGPNGVEYWLARDLQGVLAYARWENFEDVIEKARMACKASGADQNDHLLQTAKVITAGKGAQVERKDYFLSRYGCYLIAMNGDPTMPEIATAQTYFAVQTRRQEISDEQAMLEKRAEVRHRVTEATKKVNSAAKTAGVQNYALFHYAGYLGLYTMGLSDIKNKKGIKPSEQLYDRAGHTELAANDFRLTQAAEKITRESIQGERAAMETHKRVGQEVRDAIRKIGGTMPEDLPPEPSLTKLLSPKKAKLLRKP